MLRRSLTLSLIVPLGALVVLLMLVVLMDTWFQGHMPEVRHVTVILMGLICAWIPISLYARIRQRVLTPLRELRQKFQRAEKNRLEPVSVPGVRDEIGDVMNGYNQMVSTLSVERDERRRYEQERILQSQLVALGLQADGLIHELASPLAALSTHAKLAASGDTESLKTLEVESKLLTDRLKRFMSFFRDRRVSVRPIDLCSIISARIGAAGRAGIQFEIRMPPDGIEVLADEVLLTEIIDNLLQNASRHAKSKIWIDVDLQETAAVMTVTDDGPGIPPNYVQKMFRPFFTTSEGGHGLGLFISCLWAKAMGGRLELASPRHPSRGGASFVFEIPRCLK